MTKTNPENGYIFLDYFVNLLNNLSAILRVTGTAGYEQTIKFLDTQAYEIYVVEGAAVRNTMKCFKEAGYLSLEKNYSLKILDIHNFPFMRVEGKTWK